MTKAKVIKAYTDRETGDIHLDGEEVELSAARAKELSEGGFVKPIEKPKAKTAQKKEG